jgi:hypothetical protein
MCVDCVLASLRIAQVDPSDEPLPEVVLSHRASRRDALLVGEEQHVDEGKLEDGVPGQGRGCGRGRR